MTATNNNNADNRHRSTTDMPVAPAYVPLQDPFSQQKERKEKHGFWKSLVSFITCSGHQD